MPVYPYQPDGRPVSTLAALRAENAKLADRVARELGWPTGAGRAAGEQKQPTPTPTPTPTRAKVAKAPAKAPAKAVKAARTTKRTRAEVPPVKFSK